MYDRYMELFYDRLLESNVDGVSELIESNFIKEDTERVNWIVKKAMENKDASIIDALLSSGLKSRVLKYDETSDSKQTVLHLAVYCNFFEIIDKLFSLFPSAANCADSHGLSHFHVACMSGSLEFVRRFLKHGVDVEHRCFAEKWSFFTALHFAVAHERAEVVELLLKNGADPNALDSTKSTPLHLLCGGVKTETTKGGKFFADGPSESEKIAELLIGYGGNVDLGDRHGDTPMMRLFRNNDVEKNKYRSFVWDVETRRRSAREFRAKRRSLIERLLRHNADPNLTNVEGETILHLALRDVESTRRPANSLEADFEGDSDNADLVRLLLGHGAEVEVTDRRDRSPLQIAASLLNLDAVRVLLGHNADVGRVKFDHEDEDCFYYCRGALPSLEATENLIGIVEALEQRLGCRLGRRDNLAILKFFVRNNDNCRYDDPSDENVLRKLKNLLELGTNANVTRALNSCSPNHSISFLEQLNLKRIIRSIQEHLYVRESFDSNEAMRACLKNKIIRLERCLLRFLDSDERLKTEELTRLNEEIDKTRIKMLDKRTSLRDVLRANRPRVGSYRDYSAVLRSEDFSIEFPLIGGIVKGHFAKCLVRRYVAKAAEEQLRSLSASTGTLVELPELCCAKIVGYLSNECLFNLCLAAAANAD